MSVFQYLWYLLFVTHSVSCGIIIPRSVLSTFNILLYAYFTVLCFPVGDMFGVCDLGAAWRRPGRDSKDGTCTCRSCCSSKTVGSLNWCVFWLLLRRLHLVSKAHPYTCTGSLKGDKRQGLSGDQTVRLRVSCWSLPRFTWTAVVMA